MRALAVLAVRVSEQRRWQRPSFLHLHSQLNCHCYIALQVLLLLHQVLELHFSNDRQVVGWDVIIRHNRH